tara:strand:+ start:22068 stop:22247 length:180 start_codon:yes stop_codon:yes gene_type:complete
MLANVIADTTDTSINANIELTTSTSSVAHIMYINAMSIQKACVPNKAIPASLFIVCYIF